MIEGEKMDSHKKTLMLICFSHLKILTSPFYLQRLLDLSFSFSFSIFLCLFLFFLMLHLFEDMGVLMINEEKSTI
jgi:hypothetical protein